MIFAVIAKMPGRADGIKFLHSMSTWPSAEAAMEATARRLVADQTFRNRWKGCQLCPWVIDYFVEVGMDGAIIRHANDREVRA